jgi:acyl dehydratase
MHQLPKLSQLIIPSALSLLKGVKVQPGGISLQRVFDGVMIEAADVAQYRTFLEWNDPQPLCYLYLLAQRAQVALMADSEFTIAIPGMVHMANKLEQLTPLDFGQPFTLVSYATVPYKKEGSLLPSFVVDIIQNGTKVAYCESQYMAKRKSKTKSQRHEAPNLEFAVAHTELWTIPANYGRRYARVSGDINPIHVSALFAKAMGFKTSILHGWYSVGRLVKRAEELNGRQYPCIEVAFKSPVFLPSTQRLSLGQGQGTTPFMLHDENTHQLVLSGSLS